MLPRRPVVRALLVDSAYRLLLLHVTDGTATWWEAPGDKVTRREPPEGTVLRVLRDDAAVASGVRPGPCVWTVTERGRETRWHVAWLDDPNAPRAAPLTRTTLGARWWTVDELTSSLESFRPPALPRLALSVVRGDYGTVPVDLRHGALPDDEAGRCSIYARCTADEAVAFLRPLLGKPAGALGNRFFWRGLDVDVTRSDDRDANLGAEWLLWPAIVWLFPVAGARDVVRSTAEILRTFWAAGVDALAACDYEDDLPYNGGRDRPRSPRP